MSGLNEQLLSCLCRVLPCFRAEIPIPLAVSTIRLRPSGTQAACCNHCKPRAVLSFAVNLPNIDTPLLIRRHILLIFTYFCSYYSDQKFRMKQRSSFSSVRKAPAPALHLGSAPFPLPPSSSAPIIARDDSSTPRPTMIEDNATLDLQRIRSFSAAFMSSSNNTTAERPTHHNKRRRIQNQASRFRIVGQALGQKRVSRVAALANAIRRLQSEHSAPTDQPQAVHDLVSNTVLVDAWETTPLNDLKALPWEEMLRTAEQNMSAYREWQHAATRN